jgi:Tfp pilus assembly protein FimV
MVTIPYWLMRYGLPAAFLVLVTATLLVVRPMLHEGAAATVQPQKPQIVHAPKPARRAPAPRVTAYSVRSGDTLGTIADRLGTTVEELLALNPGIDPRALRVGQSLRVD